MINENWIKTTLGECAIINERTYRPSEQWPFVNYLETGQITDNRISGIHHFDASKDKIPSRARRKVRPGDIVYSTVIANNNNFGIIKKIPDNFLVSTAFAVIHGKPYIADTPYIYYYITQKNIRNYFHTLAQQSSSVIPALQIRDLEELQIPLPPIEQQQSIIHILETFDNKIHLNQQMNRTLEEISRALFKSWFVDFDPVRAKMDGSWQPDQSLPGLPAELYDLFPDRLLPSKLGEQPEGWDIVTIGDISTIVGGATPSTSQHIFWEDGHHPWVTPKDVSALSTPVLLTTSRKITDAGLECISSGLLPQGTVLMSSRAPIGYLAITEIPLAINQGFIAILPNKNISNLFFLYWCEYNISHIINYANGSTFLEINKRNFRNINLSLPIQPILKIYDEIVRNLYEQMKSNEIENILLVNMRDALLPKLLSGEIRVEDLEGVLG